MADPSAVPLEALNLLEGESLLALREEDTWVVFFVLLKHTSCFDDNGFSSYFELGYM